MEQLRAFAASSANDNTHTHLWAKGASLFIPQLSRLVSHVGRDLKVHSLNDPAFYSDHAELGKILADTGSDKSTMHNYHILYSYIFARLGVDSPLNVLEIGLGTNNPELVSSMGVNGKPGASLRAFRNYLPNAAIYGGDIDKDILFEEERIKTGYVDQLDATTFNDLSELFGNVKYDLIIDDGLHSIGANFNTLLFALEAISDRGWIVIEDIFQIEPWKTIDFILQSSGKYKTFVIQTKIMYVYAVCKIDS